MMKGLVRMLMLMVSVFMLHLMPTNGVCSAGGFQLLTSYTTEELPRHTFTRTNIAKCIEACRDAGDDKMFVYHRHSAQCQCYPWPVIIHSSSDGQEFYFSSKCI